MRPSAPSRLRRLSAACTLAAFALAPLASAPIASSQTHKVQKPESVVRAIGVYEWTGDLLKPAAARLIPVTVFINGELEDAGVFQPQPIPFALLPGNQYILQQAGIPRGLLDLRSASKEPDADTGNVDGWWAFGTVIPETHPAGPKLHASRNLSSISTSKGEVPGANTTSDTDNNHTENSPDADRPTLRRRSTTGANKTSTSTSQPDSSTTPPDDPDRPSLKRRPANSTGDTGSSDSQRAIAAVAADPDRPVLHRGVPANGGPTEANDTKELAKLAGLPKDLHQLVAVSDAANRPEHDFTRPWSDDAEHKAILTQMEAFARGRLAAYNPIAPLAPGAPRSGSLVGQGSGDGDPVSPTGGPTFTPAQGSKTSASTAASTTQRTPTTPAARRRAALAKAAAARKAAAQQKALASLPLNDEDLRAYTLSYGAAPTFVLTAHTAVPAPTPSPTPSKSTFATPSSASNSSTSTTSTINPSNTPASTVPAGAVRYVTIVAQQDTFGQLQIALASITDSTHLDRTPWMRLVGPVDVEASNRASLLFELREQGSRQFALYRVLSGHADPLFTTGTTQ